jgi:hypothetical protein
MLYTDPFPNRCASSPNPCPLRHSDLLSFIAQKESRSLELREALAQTDAELASLKKKWEGIVRRAQASLSSNPSSSSSNAALPSNRSSHGPSSSMSSDRSRDGAGGSREGSHGVKESVSSTDSLLSRETIDSGKRFLNLVLGLDPSSPNEDLIPTAAISPHPSLSSQHNASGSTYTAHHRQNSSVSSGGRSSLDIFSSAARSGLAILAETVGEGSSTSSSSSSAALSETAEEEEALSPTKKLPLQQPRPITLGARRLSSLPPSPANLASSAASASSLDPTASSSASSSSQPHSLNDPFTSPSPPILSISPRPSIIRKPSSPAPLTHNPSKDPKSALSSLAESSPSALGWGKRWGDLTAGITGNLEGNEQYAFPLLLCV